MQEETHIYHAGEFCLALPNFVSIKKAIIFARNNGLTGRLEILHILKHDTQNIVFSLSFVDKNDKIIGEVLPYFHSGAPRE